MAKSSATEINPNVINQIGIETEIKGDIISKGDIRVDGVLTGNITTSGKLVLGGTGRVFGEISCQNAHISGSIEGKITVKELLSMKSSASITGEIYTEKFAVEPGAKFTGTCNMSGNANPATRRKKNDPVAEVIANEKN